MTDEKQDQTRVTKAAMQRFVAETEREVAEKGRPENGPHALQNCPYWQALRERVGLPPLTFRDMLALRVDAVRGQIDRAGVDVRFRLRRELIVAESALLEHEERAATRPEERWVEPPEADFDEPQPATDGEA